jgi:hypothetical protein
MDPESTEHARDLPAYQLGYADGRDVGLREALERSPKNASGRRTCRQHTTQPHQRQPDTGTPQPVWSTCPR